MDDNNDNHHHKPSNPITYDSTCSLPTDYGFFGSNDTRENDILNDFGWNIHPPPPQFDRIDSGASSSAPCDHAPEEINKPTASTVSARSVENAGDIDIDAFTSSEDRPDQSSATTSVGIASCGKPPTPYETGVKVKKKGSKRIQQQRFAFVTKSEIDHLEDGYRWRKYGQKAVKNSPFPRSYYRCTNSKCTVKKRIERSSTNPTTVITTYEGQHCHHIVGFPIGLISHEGAYARYLLSSSTSQHLIYPRSQLCDQVDDFGTSNLQSQPQIVSGEVGNHLSNEHPQTSMTFQDSTRPHQGLLGDIFPTIMRN
ncbi:probable WRKY transcription factor 57 [Rutidosis leptorrhynchoides]|uniref:probable WRKY transcription factor 57 n=1 Tax=Rutidosis leptorrhynchoides TaxID=125765 RepID=UPI003A99B354